MYKARKTEKWLDTKTCLYIKCLFGKIVSVCEDEISNTTEPTY